MHEKGINVILTKYAKIDYTKFEVVFVSSAAFLVSGGSKQV